MSQDKLRAMNAARSSRFTDIKRGRSRHAAYLLYDKQPLVFRERMRFIAAKRRTFHLTTMVNLFQKWDNKCILKEKS